MFPAEVRKLLEDASRPRSRTASPQRRFTSHVFEPGDPWNEFIELWAPRVFEFVESALGPYGRAPLPDILAMADGFHASGATASFSPDSGQVTLCQSVKGKPGQTLEKLTHEFTHGSLNDFPEGDPFYEEGFVDYSVWVMAHAPVWEPYRQDMIAAAAFNIKQRRERAMKDISDWDRKRWAGGLFASLSKGPFIIAQLRMRKMEGNYTW
jgi:hypothetical protein